MLPEKILGGLLMQGELRHSRAYRPQANNLQPLKRDLMCKTPKCIFQTHRKNNFVNHEIKLQKHAQHAIMDKNTFQSKIFWNWQPFGLVQFACVYFFPTLRSYKILYHVLSANLEAFILSHFIFHMKLLGMPSTFFQICRKEIN